MRSGARGHQKVLANQNVEINNQFISKAMSTFKLILDLKKELNRVNRKIDFYIMMKMPYRKEAEYHKRLTVQLRRLSRKNWLGRSLQTLSLI